MVDGIERSRNARMVALPPPQAIQMSLANVTNAMSLLGPRLEKGPDNLSPPGLSIAYAKLCGFHDGSYCSFHP